MGEGTAAQQPQSAPQQLETAPQQLQTTASFACSRFSTFNFYTRRNPLANKISSSVGGCILGRTRRESVECDPSSVHAN